MDIVSGHGGLASTDCSARRRTEDIAGVLSSFSAPLIESLGTAVADRVWSLAGYTHFLN